MIVTILYRLDGAPATYNSNPFYDVSANAYYANAVNWASQAGIVAGYGDGSFHPNDPITRQQMAAILYRYAIYKGYYTANQSNLSTQFSDYKSRFPPTRRPHELGSCRTASSQEPRQQR